MNDFVRSEWLAERMTGVGGSDAAAVLGISKWKTPYDVYREKRGEASPTPDNWSMRWGRTMEPELRQHYSDLTGRAVLLPKSLIRHPRHQWMLATVDGATEDERVVEIKTSRSTEGWGEPGTDQIPYHYLVQVQHYMAVTGFRYADVILGVYGMEPRLYEVCADDELQELIIDAEREFWRCVEEGTPPEPVNYADVIARYGRKSLAQAVLCPQNLKPAIATLRDIKLRRALLDAEEEQAKAQVMGALGEADTLIDASGSVLVTWKSPAPSVRIDSKRLKSEQPEIFNQYAKPVAESRRFVLK